MRSGTHIAGDQLLVGAGSQLPGAADAASSAAACAALTAEAAAVFCDLGSGRPAFCIAGFGRVWACRRASSAARSMGRESAGRKDAPGRGARALFQERKKIAAQIAAAAAKSNSKSPRRALRFPGENIFR
jgi:hypothetical protein